VHLGLNNFSGCPLSPPATRDISNKSLESTCSLPVNVFVNVFGICRDDLCLHFTHADHGMLTGRATKAVRVLYLLARKALADFKLNTILTLGGVSVHVLGRTVKGRRSRWPNTRAPWATLDNAHGVYARMSTGTVRLVLRERAVPPHVLRGLRSPGQLQQYAAVSVSRCAQSCTK